MEKKEKKRMKNKYQYHCFLLHNIPQPCVGVYKVGRLALIGAEKSVTKHFTGEKKK